MILRKLLRKAPGIKYYYRIKLKLWARVNLPKRIKIANTDFDMSAHHWQVAIPCRTDTTQLIFQGKVPKEARMIYEPIELPIFENMVKDKKCFFDVGSNIGYYSHVAAAKGVRNIVAFEFMPEYAEFSRTAFEENKVPVVLINQGVGDPLASLNYGDPLASSSASKLLSLDQFAKEHNLYPDIIKMDIEGSELDALRNAHEILSRKPDLDISVHPVFLRERGQDERDIFILLESYGYKTLWSASDTYFMSARN